MRTRHAPASAHAATRSAPTARPHTAPLGLEGLTCTGPGGRVSGLDTTTVCLHRSHGAPVTQSERSTGGQNSVRAVRGAGSVRPSRRTTVTARTRAPGRRSAARSAAASGWPSACAASGVEGWTHRVAGGMHRVAGWTHRVAAGTHRVAAGSTEVRWRAGRAARANREPRA